MAKVKNKRPDWDEYFLNLADAASKRATCDRGKSGCVIVKGKRIISTGYVGSPPGMAHCDDVGHKFKCVTHEDGSQSQHCVRTIHAEQNAITQAARFGVSLDGATVYCRMTPCPVCTMLMIDCGIKRVLAERRHQTADDSEAMFKEAGIPLEYKYDEVQKYD